MYKFPRALTIHFHRLDGLKQQKFILTVLKARSLKSRCWHSVLSEGSKKELVLVSSNFWWLPAILHVSLACSCITPVSATYFARRSLCLCLSCSVLLRILSLDVGPTVIQYDLISTFNCLQRPYFQIRSRSKVLNGCEF